MRHSAPKHLAALSYLIVTLAACQPTTPGTTVTLSDGEQCTIVASSAEGRQLSCPTRGTVMAAPASEPDLRLSDIPGVPSVPPIPQSEAEATCRAGNYAQNRVRGAAESAALEAVGLPGNLLGIWRRSQSIAGRIEGQPRAADPCAGL